MLLLTRRVGEQVVIAGNIRLVVCDIRRGSVRLGIRAPSSVPVLRQELVAEAFKAVAGETPDVANPVISEKRKRNEFPSKQHIDGR